MTQGQEHMQQMEQTPVAPAQRILVTGGDGFLGRSVVAALARRAGSEAVVALDRQPVPVARHVPGVHYKTGDVRSPQLAQWLRQHRIDSVVHLASSAAPVRPCDRSQAFDVDVNGTRNVLQACADAQVRHLVVASSGAAYGSHADNPPWLTESCALRASAGAAHAHHKRLVEDMLAEWRISHPQLRQTVLRMATILGETVDNPTTALWESRRLLAVRGSDSPSVFIWDEDVAGAIVQALTGARPGCYNVAGDGALGLQEIAQRLGKRTRPLPAGLLRALLALGLRLGLSRYGPEQIDGLRYRPVLDNTALKTQLGYVPRKTSAQALDAFIAARAALGRPVTAPGAQQPLEASLR
ncbi:NAD-dependent epimerase/dehydratase family protein [Acidovorax sp. Be4]|uniref:NAD-dependent epimerase/dehydratase family protein n=1 Tax=Acidovorax bellezanensis TaxID=2976702 RepID=A0ABT2PIQ5_9BURK|nr:NAD-dependent epimerase/dehydratase family protein [Acidovorax sp. Be4]MCT9809731.1 NAD-dependent epimerase/dehydratase family protein [Acidovorax sp. Be4]